MATAIAAARRAAVAVASHASRARHTHTLAGSHTPVLSAALPVWLRATGASACTASSVDLRRSLSTSARGTAPRVASTRMGHKVCVVLREQLDNLGYKGEEVTVAPGYARNFLIPKGKAVYATLDNRSRFKVVLPDAEARANAQERELNMLKARIAAATLRFARATNDGMHLYGSVTAADIVEALQNSTLRKLNIKEKNVRFSNEERALKQVGDHSVEIEPRAGLWCKLAVVVESS